MFTHTFSGTHIHTLMFFTRHDALMLMLRKHFDEERKQYAYRYY